MGASMASALSEETPSPVGFPTPSTKPGLDVKRQASEEPQRGAEEGCKSADEDDADLD